MGDDVRVGLFLDSIQNVEKCAPIMVINENVSAIDAAGHRVINRAIVMYTW